MIIALVRIPFKDHTEDWGMRTLDFTGGMRDDGVGTWVLLGE